MNIGLLYAAVAYVCSISVLLVWFRVRALSDKSRMRTPFLRLLTFFVLFTLIDGTWGIFFSQIIKSWLFLTIFTYAFHFCAAVSAFWWAGFVSTFLGSSEQSRKAIDAARWMIFSIQIIILAANMNTHFAFSITADCVYETTSKRHILFQLQFAYYVFIIGYCAVLLTQIKTPERKGKFTAVIFFSIIPMLFGIGQMKYPDAPFYSLGFMFASIAIYLTTVTREREQTELQRKMENSRLNSIVTALASDYEAVYYIDLETNAYQNVVNENEYNNNITPMLANSNDFFADVLHNVVDIIYPDDKEMLLDLLSKENVVKACESNKPITLVYRIIIAGKTLYYHLKCVPFQEESGDKKAIIGISNIDEQMIEKQQSVEIISAIGEAYESIYQVDTINDSFIMFRSSEEAKDRYQPETLAYSEIVKNYVASDVREDYKELVAQYSDPAFLKEALKNKSSVSINFFDLHNGKERYYEMRVVKPRRFEQDGKLIIAFINRDETLLSQQREMLITSLSDDYDSVFIASLEDNKAENIRSTKAFAESHDLNDVRFFSDLVERCLKYVHPDDRTIFKLELSPENIRFKLNSQKSFYISYRQVLNDTVQYYRIKVLATENWEKKSEFIIGSSNVDELIRRQISLTEENTRKTSVLNALAESYESVCYVDLESMSYIPYFGAPHLKQWYRTNHYRNDFTAYIKAKVAKEHQKLLIDAVSEESMASYREKVAIGNTSFLSQQFRTDVNGVQKYCEFSLSRIDDKHIVAAIQDRDAIIRAEENQKHILAEAKEKAEAASKAKTTFLFNMSHDIRTPMNAVKGFIELAERNLNDKRRVADFLGKARTSGEHLLKLINDILDMSRIESGKVTIDPVPTNIREETDKLIAILGVSAKEKGVEFTTDVSSIRNNYVYSDILHIDQILLNIVSNAIKYTKPGGTVSLTITQLPDVQEGKASYCILVKDTGVGMSNDFQDHIFEEFSRAKNTTQSGIEGTGLGMAIVKRLVDMMGGDIEIASELGKGTVVQVYLTFNIAEEDKPTPEVQEVHETSLTGKKLLLVEDNELNREIARDILEYEGIVIEEAEDGAIAVEKVRMHDPDYYDYVLMDIQMPYMDGYQAAYAIRNLDNADYSSLPIIAMTANAFEDDIKNALEAGMNGHLSKPINVPELVACLKQHTRQ